MHEQEIKEGDVLTNDGLRYRDVVGKRVSDVRAFLEKIFFAHVTPSNCVYCGTRYNQLTREFVEKHRGINGQNYERVKNSQEYRICLNCGHIDD